MAKQKVDGVVEAVHYDLNGEITWVRAYERRGSTFSDCVLINRNSLIERIQAGKHFFTGQRMPLQGSTFESLHPIHAVGADDHLCLVTGDSPARHDTLDDVPII